MRLQTQFGLNSLAFKTVGLILSLFIFIQVNSNPRFGKTVFEGYQDTKKELKLNDSLDALVNTLKTNFQQKDLNFTVGVIKDGKIILKKHYGYSNYNDKTLFSDQTAIYLASTSKSLTGTLAMILDKKGIVQLDKTIADYLPDFRFDDPQLKADQITIRSLITHTHAINNVSVAIWTAFLGYKNNDQLLAIFKKFSTSYPTKNFEYSNTGSVLYSLIVEKQTKKMWQEVMDEMLFKPLKMKSTYSRISKVNQKKISYIIRDENNQRVSYLDKQDNTLSAAGGHFSTVDDMLQYLHFFIAKGNSRPGILSEESINYAISPIVSQKRNFQSYERYGYGMGWEQSMLNGEKVVSRMGGFGGIASHLSFMPERNIGIVVIGNTVGFETLPHLIANYLYQSLLEKPNKNLILEQNIATLKNGFNNSLKQNEQLQQFISKSKNGNPAFAAGNYDGGEKSGTMQIDAFGNVNWGNLKGKLYLSDSAAIIDFSRVDLIRQVTFKYENEKLVGLFSNNDRYFVKKD